MYRIIYQNTAQKYFSLILIISIVVFFCAQVFLFVPSIAQAESTICVGYTVPSDPWGDGYLIAPGLTYNMTIHGYSYCITNSSGYYYYVPVRTSSEFVAFTNAIPYLSGLTTFKNDTYKGGEGENPNLGI